MSDIDYKIEKSKAIRDSEETSTISSISYELENANDNSVKHDTVCG